MLEATALPTEPPPLPYQSLLWIRIKTGSINAAQLTVREILKIEVLDILVRVGRISREERAGSTQRGLASVLTGPGIGGLLDGVARFRMDLGKEFHSS